MLIRITEIEEGALIKSELTDQVGEIETVARTWFSVYWFARSETTEHDYRNDDGLFVVGERC